MENFKKAIETYLETKKQSEAADEAWEKEPENAELETASEKAYKKYFEAYLEAINAITKVSNGKITEDLAKRMLNTKTEELKALAGMI